MSPKRRYATKKKTTTEEGKREYQKLFMREYRVRRRARKFVVKKPDDKLTKEFEVGLASLREIAVDNQLLRAELRAAIKLFHDAHLITRDTALTDREKVFLINTKLVPRCLLPYLNECEKQTRMEMEKIE